MYTEMEYDLLRIHESWVILARAAYQNLPWEALEDVPEFTTESSARLMLSALKEEERADLERRAR